MDKTLELVFLTEGGKTVRITINDPKEDLEKPELESVMNQILQSNVFMTESGPLAQIKEARYVERSVQVIEME